MPGPKQPEKGIRGSYRDRYGVNVGPCQGLNLAHDPSTVDDTELTQAVNCRVHDGIVLSRGGQTAGATGMSGCIQGMIEVEGSGARLALVRNEAGGPAPEGNTLAGFEIFDQSGPSLLPGYSVTGLGKYTRITDKDGEHDSLRLAQADLPALGQSNYNDDTLPRYSMIWWNGFPVYYTNGTHPDNGTPKLYKVIVPDDGTDADEFQVEELFDLIADDGGAPFPVEFYPSSMVSLPNTGTVNVDAPAPLFFGTMDGGVVAYVDGAFVRLVDEGTFTGRVIVFTYNNRLFAAGKQKIMFQSNGWIDGGSSVSTAFTDVTMPAGSLPTGVADFRPNCAGEAWGGAFVGGWDEGEASNGKGVVILLSETTPGSITASIPANIYNNGFDIKRAFVDMKFGYGNRLWVTFVDPNSFLSGLGYIGGLDNLTQTPGYIPSDATDGAYCILPTGNQVLFFNTGDAGALYSYRDGGSPVLQVDLANVDDLYHQTGFSSSVPYDGVLY